MRLIKKARKAGIRVIYYILPTIWPGTGAGKSHSGKYGSGYFLYFLLKRGCMNRSVPMWPMPVTPIDTVHPSMTREEAVRPSGLDETKRTILLMPGSRLQEVKSLLPVMLDAAAIIAETVPDVQFLPEASTIDRSLLESLIPEDGPAVHIASEGVYDMMHISTAAVAASGTATLETVSWAFRHCSSTGSGI